MKTLGRFERHSPQVFFRKIRIPARCANPGILQQHGMIGATAPIPDMEIPGRLSKHIFDTVDFRRRFAAIDATTFAWLTEIVATANTKHDEKENADNSLPDIHVFCHWMRF